MKPYIKRRPFSRRSSGKSLSALSCADPALPWEFVNRISVFESLRSYEGALFRRKAHLKRLAESCTALGYRLPLSEKDLSVWIETSLKESGFRDATLRLSIHWINEEQGELLLIIRHFLSHPREWFENGVRVSSVPGRRPSPRAQSTQAKTSQYVGGVMAYLQSQDERPHEFIFFGPEGALAEGAVSNIFIIKKKCLLTPSVGSGILKGVTRDFVLELAKKRRWVVLETTLTRHDLYTADECFMTNTSSEVLPVVAMDGRKIGNGKPGPLTRALRKDFRANR